MKASRAEYPLAWPDHWPRSKVRTSSQFRTSLPGALANVEDELRRFAKDSGKKITGLLISSNVTLANQRPADPGVAIYFTWDDLPTCIAVDRYHKVEENLQAVAKCLEAERTKLRHGGLNLVRAAFTGYMKLPPPGDSRRAWHEVLGVSEDAPAKTIRATYQRLRSTHHPDKGGDAAMFHQIVAAYEEAQRRGLAP